MSLLPTADSDSDTNQKNLQNFVKPCANFRCQAFLLTLKDTNFLRKKSLDMWLVNINGRFCST